MATLGDTEREVTPRAGDRVAVGVSYPDAYRIVVPSTEGWTPIVSLNVAGIETSRWVGTTCLTGDGKHLAAVFAPTEFTNRPYLRDRGAFGAVVDLDSKQVWVLPARVALKYHNPGCGLNADVVFSRNEDADQKTTEFIRVDAARQAILDRRSVDGQFTFGSPLGDDVVASRDGAIVAVDVRSHLRTVATTDGQAVDLHPAVGSSIDFIDVDPTTGKAIARRSTLSGEVTDLATGRAGSFTIRSGRLGKNHLVGVFDARQPPAGEIDVLRADSAPEEVSIDASVIVDSVHHSGVEPLKADIPTGASVTAHGASNSRKVTSKVLDSDPADQHHRTTQANRPIAYMAANVTSPKCAIAPVDYRVQVMQPTPSQVEWAANRAVRGLLTDARPANWNNNGLASYAPQTAFPRKWTGSAHVPVQVLLGVVAQESNIKQASSHALPGLAGDPLIADYYGTVYDSSGHVVGMDFNNADCGYGIAQVTDHMTATDGYYSANGKKIIATDYEANLAVAVKTLESKWDETRASPFNLVMNDGSTNGIENWYTALWAYNTGLNYPNPDRYGVGWTNNPANADYDPTRQPYLRATYDDAAHPYKWPYQEKVLGWIEIPQIDYRGAPSYSSIGSQLRLSTNYFQFCSLGTNACDPNYNTAGTLSYCTRSDRQCWWHGPSSWTLFTTPEYTGAYVPGASEPAATNPHPPDCSGATGDLFTTTPAITSLPAGTAIVDDVPDTMYNIVGCPSRPSPGSFSLTFATASGGAPTSKIDFHQIGGGYGGHFWFAHTVDPARTSMIVTGTWTPPSTSVGWTRIMVHIPDHGADTYQAAYKIWSGTKTYTRVVNQRWTQNVWVDLGIFNLGPGANVSLTNATLDDWAPWSGSSAPAVDVAYDAVSFSPSSKPSVSYVAIGDSYNAGEGVEPYYKNADRPVSGGLKKNACHRSPSAYPPLLSTRLHGKYPGPFEFHFLACSGAVMDAVSGTTVWMGESPQLAQGFLDENTTHVSVGISGNDAGFGDILKGCFLTIKDCLDPAFRLTRDGVVDTAPLIDYEPTLIRSLEPKLEALITRVKAAAPNARVLVMGYPHVISEYDDSLYSLEQIQWFAQMGDLLNGQMRTAAQAQNVGFVDPRSAFAGHEAGGSPEWINGVIAYSDSGSGLAKPGSGSFHPNALGHLADLDLMSASW